MALFISSLNSGSNGNCYYIGTPEEAVLVDAGLSCRETEKRMKRLSLSMHRIKGILVSHEHSDHIFGIAGIVKKYKIPVYITARTLQESKLKIDRHLIRTFLPLEPVQIGDLTVTAFPKSHDACDPHSFIVYAGKVTVGVFTDIGLPCNHVQHHFSRCHAAFLEANFDEVLLETGKYPLFLKNRIRGDQGHLSNTQALQIFMDYKPSFMTHLILSHLSRENNSPERVEALFRGRDERVKIVVASRYAETPLYQVVAGSPFSGNIKKRYKQIAPAQLSLF
jgi:phosphoribosyl 1,2-cyclic phosphodiesterase